ncbi:MAG: hypothetical protein N3G77_05035, partial [Nitrososphaeria archaeon]|nr:hypothetical protein [Nitrososphaeria archaeon]
VFMYDLQDFIHGMSACTVTLDTGLVFIHLLRLGDGGVRYARRFSWDDIIRKYLKLFIEILKERR